jgi:hypothetical protein
LTLELRGERFQKLFNAGLNSFIQEARLLARFNHVQQARMVKAGQQPRFLNKTIQAGVKQFLEAFATQIKEVIGGGGFGIVYRAWDHQLERTIAIKEYMPVSLGAVLLPEAQHVQQARMVKAGQQPRFLNKTIQAGVPETV